MNNKEIPLVLYHANCWDGFCAAWIAKKVLGEIEAIPVHYGQDVPIEIFNNKRDVYILDFSYPREITKKIIAHSDFVCILDHHATAQKELQSVADEIDFEGGSWIPHIAFDMTKSGGRLAWEYFCTDPLSSWANIPVPWLVDYTEDRDLWRWKLPDSKAINAWLRTFALDFKIWDQLEKQTLNAFDGAYYPVGEGYAILRREKQIINDHIRHAREIEMNDHKILVVNATILFSEIAGELAKDRPFGACYFDRQDGKRQWSLRSDNNNPNSIDVSEIAKLHGGGGHKHASGFEEILNNNDSGIAYQSMFHKND